MSDSFLYQFLRDVRAVDNFNTILALWARSLVWQQQNEAVSGSGSVATETLRRVRRLLLVAQPTDDDVVFL